MLEKQDLHTDILSESQVMQFEVEEHCIHAEIVFLSTVNPSLHPQKPEVNPLVVAPHFVQKFKLLGSHAKQFEFLSHRMHLDGLLMS